MQAEKEKQREIDKQTDREGESLLFFTPSQSTMTIIDLPGHR